MNPDHSERPADPTNIPGRRIVAFTIDLAVYAAACVVSLQAFSPEKLPPGLRCDTTPSPDDARLRFCSSFGDSSYLLTGSRAGYFLLSLGALWWLLHAVIQRIASTPGKALMGIAVIGPDGQRAGVARLFWRSVPLAVGAMFVGIGFGLAAAVGLVMILAHTRHQRVGDLIAKTYVVRREHVGHVTLPAVSRVELSDDQPPSTL